MRSLWLVLLGGAVAFVIPYALEDRQTFFGGAPAVPQAGDSDRAEVERALAGLDDAMARYYRTGDEGPARQVLAEPDGEGSPLPLWRADRAAYVAAGASPSWALRGRELSALSLSGPQNLTATARERWTRRLGADELESESSVRYAFRRTQAGLRVEDVAVSP